MRRFLIELLLILLIFTALIFGAPFYMPRVLQTALGSRLGADVRVEEARVVFKEGIVASNLSVTNKKGLRCSVEKAIINFGCPSLIAMIKERTLYLPFKLINVRFQSSGSTAVGAITEALGFNQLELVVFDKAAGKLYFKGKEVVLKEIEAKGEDIELFIDGTITNESLINCSLKMLLSDELLAKMPEPTRKFFFKEDEPFSKVELYLSGEINRPSVNFSTPLFKLTIR